MQKWFTRALSPIFANITIDILDDLDEVEVRHSFLFFFPLFLINLSLLQVFLKMPSFYHVTTLFQKVKRAYI